MEKQKLELELSVKISLAVIAFSLFFGVCGLYAGINKLLTKIPIQLHLKIKPEPEKKQQAIGME